MSFRHAKARQPEIIRAVQKDLAYTTELTEDFSDILKLTGPRNWIRYNNICRLLAEIAFHGFTSLNGLQTLGEEYTGILQVDSTYVSLPYKLVQLIAIILEFGGDSLYYNVLIKLEKEVTKNKELRPEARNRLLAVITFMKSISPYIKALHKTVFYFTAGKYQLSKRITGINYVLVRHWLQPDHSLYGYRILGWITFLQLSISILSNIREAFFNSTEQTKIEIKTDSESRSEINEDEEDDEPAPACNLCLEPRRHTSITPCGHLFCWKCIIEWLDEKDDCPVCREYVKKSNVVQLLNYR